MEAPEQRPQAGRFAINNNLNAGVSQNTKPTRKNLPSLANSKSRGNSKSSKEQQQTTGSSEPQFAMQIRRGNNLVTAPRTQATGS